MGVWRGGGDWWFIGVRRQWHGFGFLSWVAVFFFLVLTVDYGLLVVVAVVSGVCSAAVVAIVVLEQKEREKE